ncbi:15140_t:CDS:2, partial [Entrophospora sp. SA101]
MSNLVIKIENFLLEGSFDAICGVTVVYLTMEGTIIPPYNSVRDLADRAVNSALTKIENTERRTKVLEVLTQHPMTNTDASLYDVLKKKMHNINPSELTWQDPIAIMVL